MSLDANIYGLRRITDRGAPVYIVNGHACMLIIDYRLSIPRNCVSIIVILQNTDNIY